MAKKLKQYEKVQAGKGAKPPELKHPSGVACTEKGCSGEMMIVEPRQRHPQYKDLERAHCSKCGWRGWV